MVGSNSAFESGLFIKDNGEETELIRSTRNGCSSFNIEVTAIYPAGKLLDISNSKQHILFSCWSEASSVLSYQNLSIDSQTNEKEAVDNTSKLHDNSFFSSCFIPPHFGLLGHGVTGFQLSC